MKTEQMAETSNVIRAAALVERCVALKKIGLVEGAPGLGKTFFAQNYAQRHGAIYVRARSIWSVTGGLSEILNAIVGHRVELHNVRALAERLADELADLPGTPLLVDESDYLLGCVGLLHLLRDLFDVHGTIVVFISIGSLARELTAPRTGLLAAVASRLGGIARFERATIQDAELLARELLSVSLGRDLIADCLRRSNGSLRPLMTSFEEIERVVELAGEQACDLARWKQFQEIIAPRSAPATADAATIRNKPLRVVK